MKNLKKLSIYQNTVYLNIQCYWLVNFFQDRIDNDIAIGT